MARRLIPQKIIEESDHLFGAYMLQKKGPFSHEDMIAYVEKHASAELLEYIQTEKTAELIK